GEAADEESIEDLVSRKELGRAVAKAMALLPDEQRTAIILKEYHGLTFQEIADLLDCPLSTVKTRLYQGLTVLRKHLRQAGVESTFGPDTAGASPRNQPPRDGPARLPGGSTGSDGSARSGPDRIKKFAPENLGEG